MQKLDYLIKFSNFALQSNNLFKITIYNDLFKENNQSLRHGKNEYNSRGNKCGF